MSLPPAQARAGESNALATISSASEMFCGVFKLAYLWPGLAWPGLAISLRFNAIYDRTIVLLSVSYVATKLR